jgi:hypothetical protein
MICDRIPEHFSDKSVNCIIIFNFYQKIKIILKARLINPLFAQTLCERSESEDVQREGSPLDETFSLLRG